MSNDRQAKRNKEFVRAHFEEFVNRKNAAVILQNMTADFYDHDGPDGKATDAAGDKAMMEAMYDQYPDLRVTVEEMIAEGDRVACDREGDGEEDRVSWVCAVAAGRRQTRGAMGDGDMPNYGRWLPGSEAFGGMTEVSPYRVRLGTTYLDAGPLGQRPGSVTGYDPPFDWMFGFNFHLPNFIPLKRLFYGK